MSGPRISVVMSVYNGMPYLPQAVDSILGQTFRDLEFIVIDDGSTDASPTYLAASARRDPRLIVLRNPGNMGYTRSLNRGFGQARGRYLARQDADDLSLPERLELQVTYLEANPDVGLVGTFPRFIDEEGLERPSPHYPLLVDSLQIHEALPDSNCFRHGSVVFRRRLIERVGLYDPDLEPSEDYDLWLRFSEVTKLANLARPLYLYREHEHSVSSKRRFRQMLNKARALEAAIGRRYPSASPPRRLVHLLARDLVRVAFIGYATGLLEDARQACQHAIRLVPRMGEVAPIIEDVVDRYLNLEPASRAFVLGQGLFDDLLPQHPRLKRSWSRIRARLHMRVVFEAQAGNEAESVAEHLWRGVRGDPGWLLNRGVWSIGLRHLTSILRKADDVTPEDPRR